MKILQISNIDTFGSKFNGVDLASSLNKHSIETKVYAWDKKTKNENVYKLIQLPGKKIIRKIINIIENFLSIQSLLYPFSFFLYFKKYFKSADLVHYHLIHTGFFNLLSLPLLTKRKPSVWTLHDPWAITGHCIYPYNCKKYLSGCGQCETLKSPIKMHFDNTKLMWKIKKIIFKKSKFDIIVASNYMHKMVTASPLTDGHKIHTVPFGIDLNIYKPISQDECKKKLNIKQENFVIFFRASESEYKGQTYIKECLKNINTNKPISIITSDYKNQFDEFKDKFQVIDLGWIMDNQLLAEAYNTCDIFLMPSTAEAFGLMAAEAMACGKTVLTFEGTSIEEVICSPTGGIAVRMRDYNALRAAIEDLINDPEKNKIIGNNALEIAKVKYNQNSYIINIANIYKEIIARNK